MCPCGVDHWLHVALGFQGLLGMMSQLEPIPCSPAALEKLEEYLAKLQTQVQKLRSAP